MRLILRHSCLTFIVGLQVILVVSTMPSLPKMKLIKLLAISKAINMMMIVCLTISFILPQKLWRTVLVVLCYMVTSHTVCFSQHLYLSLKTNLAILKIQTITEVLLCVLCALKKLEYVLLFKYQVYLSTSNLQFDFKEKSSTTQCTWLSK